MFAGGTERGDKALLDLGGRPMLAHVAATIASQVSRLILNANGDPARFESFGLEIVPDTIADKGPLAGLHAAMTWAVNTGAVNTGAVNTGAVNTGAVNAGLAAGTIATVPSDVPFMPHDTVNRLLEARGPHAKAVALARSGGQRHPTIALWPIALLPDIERALARGHLSLDRLAHDHGAIEVPFPMRDIGGETIDPFFNANTPEDLARARRLMAEYTQR